MNLVDFHIGLDFKCGAFSWRVTDIGTRTVAAIRLVQSDPVWYVGPPYMVEEVVLDEADLHHAHPTEEEAIRASIPEADTSGDPGFPHELMSRITGRAYGRKRLLQFDRVRADGEILHPHEVRHNGDSSIIRSYLPFTREWAELDEADFLGLPCSTPEDVSKRADREK